LRYQSGALVQTPPSSNNLLTQLDRGPENNPALWGGGHTFWNRVPGQAEFLIDPEPKGLRSNQAVGSESGRLVGCPPRAVWGFHTLLQWEPLAATTL